MNLISGWTLMGLQSVILKNLTVFKYLPMTTWGSVWMFLGTISVLFAFVRRDAVGFVAAYLMPSLWGLAYLASWFPLHELGAVQAVRSAVLTGCYALLIQIISGWVEEPSTERAKANELD
jgi:hypothetical protein